MVVHSEATGIIQQQYATDLNAYLKRLEDEVVGYIREAQELPTFTSDTAPAQQVTHQLNTNVDATIQHHVNSQLKKNALILSELEKVLVLSSHDYEQLVTSENRLEEMTSKMQSATEVLKDLELQIMGSQMNLSEALSQFDRTGITIGCTPIETPATNFYSGLSKEVSQDLEDFKKNATSLVRETLEHGLNESEIVISNSHQALTGPIIPVDPNEISDVKLNLKAMKKKIQNMERTAKRTVDSTADLERIVCDLETSMAKECGPSVSEAIFQAQNSPASNAILEELDRQISKFEKLKFEMRSPIVVTEVENLNEKIELLNKKFESVSSVRISTEEPKSKLTLRSILDSCLVDLSRKLDQKFEAYSDEATAYDSQCQSILSSQEEIKNDVSTMQNKIESISSQYVNLEDQVQNKVNSISEFLAAAYDGNGELSNLEITSLHSVYLEALVDNSTVEYSQEHLDPNVSQDTTKSSTILDHLSKQISVEKAREADMHKHFKELLDQFQIFEKEAKVIKERVDATAKSKDLDVLIQSIKDLEANQATLANTVASMSEISCPLTFKIGSEEIQATEYIDRKVTCLDDRCVSVGELEFCDKAFDIAKSLCSGVETTSLLADVSKRESTVEKYAAGFQAIDKAFNYTVATTAAAMNMANQIKGLADPPSSGTQGAADSSSVNPSQAATQEPTVDLAQLADRLHGLESKFNQAWDKKQEYDNLVNTNEFLKEMRERLDTGKFEDKDCRYEVTLSRQKLVEAKPSNAATSTANTTTQDVPGGQVRISGDSITGTLTGQGFSVPLSGQLRAFVDPSCEACCETASHQH